MEKTIEMVEAKFLVYDLLFKIQNPHTSNEDRRKAEDSLKSLSQFTVQHVKDLCEIIESPELPRDSKSTLF
jgi:hypothetical protein